MSLSKNDMLDLMAYADGELDGAKVAHVETLLGANDEARLFVAELGGLSEVVTRTIEARVARFSIDVTAGVMSAIESGSLSHEALTIRPATPPVVAPPAAVAPNNVRSLDAARQKRRTAVGMVAAALAVAAGAFLVLRAPASLPNLQQTAALRADNGQTAVEPGNAPTPAVAPPQEVLAMASDVDVNSVESPNNVSVFYLQGSAASMSSVVVWIDETRPGR